MSKMTLAQRMLPTLAQCKMPTLAQRRSATWGLIQYWPNVNPNLYNWKCNYNYVDWVINYWTTAVPTLIISNSVYLKFMLAVYIVGPTLFTQRQRTLCQRYHYWANVGLLSSSMCTKIFCKSPCMHAHICSTNSATSWRYFSSSSMAKKTRCFSWKRIHTNRKRPNSIAFTTNN